MLDIIMKQVEEHAVYVQEKDQLMLDVKQIKAILREHLDEQAIDYSNHMKTLEDQLTSLNKALTQIYK